MIPETYGAQKCPVFALSHSQVTTESQQIVSVNFISRFSQETEARAKMKISI
jgi:hypothetical protein